MVNFDHRNRIKWEGPTPEITTIGIDLAKDVFEVHGVNRRGQVVLQRIVFGEAHLRRIMKSYASYYN
jgi:hypothetical protein